MSMRGSGVAVVSSTCPPTVLELFQIQALLTPGAVAVVSAGRRVTYGRLDALANRVASGLRAAGAGPEVPVGVNLDRSIGAVAALLGIWKSGAVYVPLDTSQPAERLRFMAEDAKTQIVIVRGQGK